MVQNIFVNEENVCWTLDFVFYRRATKGEFSLWRLLKIFWGHNRRLISQCICFEIVLNSIYSETTDRQGFFSASESALMVDVEMRPVAKFLGKNFSLYEPRKIPSFSTILLVVDFLSLGLSCRFVISTYEGPTWLSWVTNGNPDVSLLHLRLLFALVISFWLLQDGLPNLWARVVTPLLPRMT